MFHLGKEDKFVIMALKRRCGVVNIFRNKNTLYFNAKKYVVEKVVAKRKDA
jgi:hypothetical protein